MELPNRKMLTTEDRIEVIFLSGREGCSHKDIAEEFNRRHPDKKPIARSTVTRLIRKFKKTGNVADAPRSGRPNKSPMEVEVTVLAKFIASPTKSVRRNSKELGVPRSNIQRILKKHNFHPYKLQLLHHMTEDDPDRRTEMCDWFLGQLNGDTEFLSSIMFSDEAIFMLTARLTVKTYAIGQITILIGLQMLSNKEPTASWFGAQYGRTKSSVPSFLMEQSQVTKT